MIFNEDVNLTGTINLERSYEYLMQTLDGRSVIDRSLYSIEYAKGGSRTVTGKISSNQTLEFSNLYFKPKDVLNSYFRSTSTTSNRFFDPKAEI